MRKAGQAPIKKSGDATMQYTVHYDKTVGENTKFWRAAGLDHLFFLTHQKSGQALLDRAEAHGTIRYVRNHYTLSSYTLNGISVGGDVYSEDENGVPIYDFSKINAVFSEYVKRGIKPIVEYDYIPYELLSSQHRQLLDEGHPVPNCGPKDWDKWRELMYAFTVNLRDTFGLDEIRTWFFEVYNEPDAWPTEDIDTFYRMYDLFAHTVKSVDSALRVGGPGCFREHFLKVFLEHVANGIDFVTGERGTAPIDFISYHIYGMSSAWIHDYPLVVPTVQRFIQEHLWVQRLIGRYPRLRGLPFHLNEWGICSMYEMTRKDSPEVSLLRDTEFSALFFVKLVCSLYTLRERYGFCPALMLYWGFSFEAHNGFLFNGERSLTTAGDLPKPILTAMELLERTGSSILLTDGPKNGGPVGLLATAEKASACAEDACRIQLIAYHLDEQAPHEGDAKEISVGIEALDGQEIAFECFTIDQDSTAYGEWVRQGCPQTPDKADMDALMKAAAPTPTTFRAPIVSGRVDLKLPLHPSSMLLLCGVIHR